MKSKYANAWLALASIAIGMALAEAGFRYWAWSRFNDVISHWQHELYLAVPGSPLEYVLRPDVARINRIPETGDTWRYVINHYGRRDSGPNAGPDDLQKIVFLGDSYTFGWAVDQNDVLPVVVKRELAAAPYRQRVHSINLGIPGYNTEQEYHLLEDYLATGHADMVILGHVVNDAEPQHNIPARPSTRYRYTSSWLMAFLLDRLHRTWLPNADWLVPEINRHGDYRVPFRKKGRKLADARRALAHIVALCEQRNIPLLVVVFPDFSQQFDSSYPYQIIRKTVLRWASELDVPAVDILAEFRDSDHRQWWVEGDSHPNGAAFARIARVLAPEIVSRLLLRHEVVAPSLSGSIVASGDFQ